MNLDLLLSGVFEVLESNVLNGTSIYLKNQVFRKYIMNLISLTTDLAQKPLSNDKAKENIKMALAENRKAVDVIDRVFKEIPEDAIAYSLKKSLLINPAMGVRHSLRSAMRLLEKGV